MIGNSTTSIGAWAFCGCNSLTSITIPNRVISIWSEAFSLCYRLAAVYFEGNAPTSDTRGFIFSDGVIVYYLPGTTGLDATFARRSVRRFFRVMAAFKLWPGTGPG